jgi:ubiquitin-like 1-activating enzyme E1 A
MWNFHKDTGSQKPTTETDLAKFHHLVIGACRDFGLPVGIVSPGFTASFARNIGTELSPIAAILGGVLAQDILNYLGQREQPIQNWVIFDGDNSAAPIYSL